MRDVSSYEAYELAMLAATIAPQTASNDPQTAVRMALRLVKTAESEILKRDQLRKQAFVQEESLKRDGLCAVTAMAATPKA